jgi:hypothetical protein
MIFIFRQLPYYIILAFRKVKKRTAKSHLQPFAAVRSGSPPFAYD